MISFVAFEFFLKKKHMLKFEFYKSFHAKCNKFKLFLFVNRTWSGLVGKTLVCFNEVLSSILDRCVH
jgi:hypothetical protein